jgi:hypothetical protein
MLWLILLLAWLPLIFGGLSACRQTHEASVPPPLSQPIHVRVPISGGEGECGFLVPLGDEGTLTIGEVVSMGRYYVGAAEYDAAIKEVSGTGDVNVVRVSELSLIDAATRNLTDPVDRTPDPNLRDKIARIRMGYGHALIVYRLRDQPTEACVGFIEYSDMSGSRKHHLFGSKFFRNQEELDLYAKTVRDDCYAYLATIEMAFPELEIFQDICEMYPETRCFPRR